jgi:hypothetical protein
MIRIGVLVFDCAEAGGDASAADANTEAAIAAFTVHRFIHSSQLTELLCRSDLSRYVALPLRIAGTRTTARFAGDPPLLQSLRFRAVPPLPQTFRRDEE